MAETSCKFCGAAVSLGKAPAGARLSAECRSCGALFWTIAPEPTGFETIWYRQTPKPEGTEASAVSADLEPSTGTVLLIPGQDSKNVAGPAPAQTLRRANLVVEGSPRTHLPLTGARTEVGRNGAHIVIADPALSASHFVIEAHGQSYVIRDLGSSNGTRLNGHNIRSARLVSGDTILAGGTKFSFRIEEVIPL